MLRRREEILQRVTATAAKFKEKGATTLEKALITQKLGLSPRFEEAMHRRLGKSGIFIEVNGKYYLSEQRFEEIHERMASR
jgi:hypothetical protein